MRRKSKVIQTKARGGQMTTAIKASGFEVAANAITRKTLENYKAQLKMNQIEGVTYLDGEPLSSSGKNSRFEIATSFQCSTLKAGC
jgi:hypothetical protein